MPSRSLDALQPSFRSKAEELLEAWKAAGLDVIVTSTLRTNAEQAALYAQGRTTPGKVVTKAKPGTSWHNWGLALDAVPLLAGKPAWDVVRFKSVWALYGKVIRAQGLSWGGDWKTFKDYPHVEWHPGLTLAAVNAMGYDKLRETALA
jgi:peptidoglycan LD-endopeptidase CwlK